jgi:hypothetical protein
MENANTPIKFDIYSGDQLVRTEILSEATIKVGKLASSHLRIDDESVSRMHAVVEVGGPDNVVLLDLGSAVGTFVNGERITKRVLQTGDQVVFGQVRAIVAISGQAAQPTAAPQVAAVNVPLFDEEDSTGGPRTLEVMALWGTTVLDVRHIGSGDYVVGDTADSDQYADPALLGAESFLLASASGGEMVVNVPQGVAGDVMLDGKVYTLDELAAAGKLGKGHGQSRSLRLPPRARCRLVVGNVTFLINSVLAAVPVRRTSFWQQLDPQLVRYLLSAAILHGLFFAIVLSIPEDADSLNVDGFDMSDRFVEFILKPEEEKQELKDLFKGMKEEQGKAAEKAKGDEGKLGKKDSDQQNKRFAVKGPADNQEIQLAKERAKMEAINTADAAFNQLEGELSAVWGSGDRAVGNDAVAALGNMFGDQVGTAQGFGGLGTAGVGRGGGGFGEASIGVGNVGTRGRGGGSGTGYGRGVSRLGRKQTKTPKVIPGKPIITGSLDRETIRRVIRRHRNEYRYCYEKELNTKRDLNGKIIMKFTIAGNGAVIASKVLSSTMNNRNVENCIAKKIKRWMFPAPKGGGIVVVKYPFIFKPS